VHRKDWEIGFVLKALKKKGLLVAGKKGLVFGCGNEETVPALANFGLSITATDQPIETGKGSDWDTSGQYCSGKESFRKFDPQIGPWQNFEKNITFFCADMNNLDFLATGHDFLWTSCTIEHLGSKQNTLRFLFNSMKYLVSGGLAIHTTEYDWFTNQSLDHPRNCVFNREDFDYMARFLRLAGHWMLPIDYSVGTTPQDLFIDEMPFSFNKNPPTIDEVSDCGHLKLKVGNKFQTSLGFIVVARHFYMA
jgi:hypothetical protein